MKLGLFGRPVAHSRSPRLFARLAVLLKRPVSYEAVLVAGRLQVAVVRARAAGWRGANVTVPLKETAAALADRLTSEAAALGAVNVLRFGRLVEGHNTDADGLRDALRAAGFAVRGKRALVFGAGGAARAAGWALAREGAKSVRFSARTPSRARRSAHALAPHFPNTRFSAGAPAAAEVWVNATPLGMKGFPDRSPAPKSLPSPALAVDLVYGRRTAFQRDAAARGARVADGAGMLVHQALRAWEYWDKPLGAKRRTALAVPLLKEVLK
ncbi:MAG TPA: shikimate dehydrogenase [Elusimicrobiota bacterium]|nr:shikimate dehydrogenase [Elusimicrobiota bacterium]